MRRYLQKIEAIIVAARLDIPSVQERALLDFCHTIPSYGVLCLIHFNPFVQVKQT